MPQAILLQDVESLGDRGTVIDVSAGYLRNYLVPRKLAQPATNAALGAAQAKMEADERAASEASERAEENAALLERINASGRLLVTAELDDEHASVAVEGDLAGGIDHGFGEDRLHAIAGGQPEPPGSLVRRERPHGGLRRKVGFGVGGIFRVGCGAGTWAAAGSLNRARDPLRRNRVEERRERGRIDWPHAEERDDREEGRACGRGPNGP